MKRFSLYVGLIVGLAFISWGVGGCGSRTSQSGSGAEESALNGDWTLQENGCDGLINFSNSVTFEKTGNATTNGKEAELYDLSGEGTEPGQKAVFYTSENLIGYCLDPAGVIIDSECNLMCAGTLSGAEFSGNCQFNTNGDVCGPVTYRKN